MSNPYPADTVRGKILYLRLLGACRDKMTQPELFAWMDDVLALTEDGPHEQETCRLTERLKKWATYGVDNEGGAQPGDVFLGSGWMVIRLSGRTAEGVAR